jgi:RNA polymerase sigma-70 factor (ECF subfamily)
MWKWSFGHWSFIGHPEATSELVSNFDSSARRAGTAVVYIHDGDAMTHSTEALVTRSRTGDRAAFELLVRATARWVFAQIYLETADAHRAEDLVQETFLRAWRKLGSLADAKSFRPWVASIARGVVLDSAKRDLRKKRGGGAMQEQQSLLTLADTNPTPPESAEQLEQRQRMLSMLRGLPEQYREVLSLRYLAGADYDTIATQLALSNGSLRGLLNRGMKMLRERMNET